MNVIYNHPSSREESSSVTLWNVFTQAHQTYTDIPPDRIMASFNDEERAEVRDFFYQAMH